MGKYEPLQEALEHSDSAIVPFSFEEIEELLGARLPKSAREYRPWWSNDEKSHSQARAWLRAGYRATEVNLEGEQVVFVRDEAVAAVPKSQGDGPRRHPIFGCMAGSVTIPPGVDICAPADPSWGQSAGEGEG